MVGGNGPPVLLLHGYPQSHVMWHSVAPLLAEDFTVVAADLAGYGASFRPTAAPDHMPHSKRAMAADQVEAMAVLGFDRFAVAGHDRGGRVAYRMAFDHPDRVERLAVLDIVPTGEVWKQAAREFAGYWHWAFLAQPAPLPESLIGADPQAYFDLHVRAGMGLGREPDRYPAAVMEAYRRALDDPGAVEGMCEDYRAGATVDLKFDDADRAAGNQIACAVLVLWARARRAPARLSRRVGSLAPLGSRRSRRRARRHALPGRGPPGGDRRRTARLPPRAVAARPAPTVEIASGACGSRQRHGRSTRDDRATASGACRLAPATTPG